MKLSAILAPLIAAGVPGSVILETVKAFEDQHTDALEKRRQSDRERQAKHRSHVTSRDVTVTVPSREGVARVEDNLQTKNTSGQEGKKERAAKPRGDLDAFKFELSPILDTDRIEALCAVRRKKGATFSAHAGKLLAKALLACPNAAEAADEMVLRNWTGVKPDWLESRRSGAPPRGRETVVDAMHEIFRERGWTDEPAQFSGHLGNGELLPEPERGRETGAVVDLRSGAWRRA